jgi:hypothetical protein
MRVGSAPLRITVSRTAAQPPAVPPSRFPEAAATVGAYAEPPRPDLRLSPSIEGERLTIALSAETSWEGRLSLDCPRGRAWLGRRLPLPAADESRRRYHVQPTRLYQVVVGGKALEPLMGDDLLLGLPLKVEKALTVTVEPLPGPPYGGAGGRLSIEAPAALGGDGPFRLPLTVGNDTGQPQAVRLTATLGTVEPAELKLDAGAKGQAAVIGSLMKDGEVSVTASAPGVPAATCTTRLVHDKTLVGLVAFDDQEYKGTRYLWCGKEPFQFTLPAKKGQAHTLHLLWGAKGDQRAAVLTLNGQPRSVAHGGYDGFQWLKVPIEAGLVTGDALAVRVAPDPQAAKPAAFLAEARLTAP